LHKVKGAYSLLIMDKDCIAGVRDPLGFRPLCIGKLNESYIIASETCALDLVGAEFVREIKPGEIVIINQQGIQSYMFAESKNHAFCVFEYVYFSRPDSYLIGENVHLVREKMGRVLAREHPVKADLVIGVPDSGTSAALGFSKESKIPLEVGMIRNHYIGRTFIQPYQERRELAVKLKFNLIKKIIVGKKIVIVDDSIVRGTTSRIRVQSFRDAGATEIHLRISCPPHRFGCYYGIDFPAKTSLVAYNKTVQDIRKYLGVDSLGYLSTTGMLKCLPGTKKDYCIACWKGNYPIRVKEFDKLALEKTTV
jgi:amidophosphoribosyltransferase